VFTNIGCMVCHTGELLGGSMFEKVGVVEEWTNQGDQGRFAVSKKDADRMMFKVPSLRNVEKTAPYFHDGSAATLEQAVRMMGRHQLGLELTERERTSVVAWLKSLTGALPTDYIRVPQLPASSEETPRPDPS
jgi:cytochrome c peroxidase